MDRIVLKSADISLEYLSGKLSPEASHCHDLFEIFFVLNGEGKYTAEGGEVLLKSGTLCLLRPIVHHSLAFSEDSNSECSSLHFPASALVGAAPSMLLSLIPEGESGRCFSSVALSDMLLGIFDRLENSSRLPYPEREEYVKMLLSEIILFLSATSSEKMTVTDDELGARVVRYLNGNAEKNISLDKLAGRFFVSKYHLCRAFKKYTGTSVHSYINQKRIMYAKQLIDAGETAQSAAFKVGFGDYSAFYRAYIRIVGKSPRAEQIGTEED